LYHCAILNHQQLPLTYSTHNTILTVTGGSNTESNTKRQRQDYYREVNHVAVEGPINQTKWSHILITFANKDINLTSFPHIDAMVITVHIHRWDVSRILIDNGSQAEILFLSAIHVHRWDRKASREENRTVWNAKLDHPISLKATAASSQQHKQWVPEGVSSVDGSGSNQD
jgi:hypothetical protein